MNGDDRRPIVFLAFANSYTGDARYLRNLSEEARRVQKALERAVGAGLCEVVERSNVNSQDLFDVFLDPRYRGRIAIFHFAGHANGFQLLLDSSEGSLQVAHAGGFAAFLGQEKGLQLVFLNGCSTHAHVQGLLNANVSVVIATARAIDDQAAMEMSARFYEALGAGDAIGKAYATAESVVRTARGDNPRDFYYENAEEVDRWPWEIAFRPGAAKSLELSLPGLVGDYLYDLPEFQERSLPDEPYRNLSWFTRAEAEIFFGRGREIRALYQDAVSDKSARIILLYGQTGAGKSSLLEAGLIPRLQGSHQVSYARRGQGQDLTACLRAAISLGTGDRSWRDGWASHLAGSNRGPAIVILDQVEAALAGPAQGKSEEFESLLNCLQSIFGRGQEPLAGRVILGFRKEWLAEIKKAVETADLAYSTHFLERLDRSGIIDAIEGPTRSQRCREKYRLTIERGLAERISDDLLRDTTSPIAPILQILLSRMWAAAKKANPDRPHFDLNMYLTMEAEGIHLDSFFDRQLATLGRSMPAFVNSGLALDLLEYHTRNAEPAVAAERSRNEIETAYPHAISAMPEFMNECKQLYLLVESGLNSDEPPSTRVYHDTLAPVVRKRFHQSSRPGQRARRILESRSTEWEGDQDGTPLDESDLAAVERGEPGMRCWTHAERRLVTASRRKFFRRYGWGLLVLFVTPGVIASVAQIDAMNAAATRILLVLGTGIMSFGTWLLYRRLRTSPVERQVLAITIVVIAALIGVAFDQILSSPLLTNYAFPPEIAFSLLGALPLIGLAFVIISHRQAGWRNVPYWAYLIAIFAGAYVGWLGYDLVTSVNELRNKLPELRMALDTGFPDELLLSGTPTARGLSLIVIKPGGGKAKREDVSSIIQEADPSKRLVRKVRYIGFDHPIANRMLSTGDDISSLVDEVRPSIIDSLEVWADAIVFVGFGYRVRVGVFPVIVAESGSQTGDAGEPQASEPVSGTQRARELADRFEKELFNALKGERRAFEVVNVQPLLKPYGNTFTRLKRYNGLAVASLMGAARVDIGIFAALYPEPAKNDSGAGASAMNYRMHVFLMNESGGWQNIAIPEFPTK
jgi:CHAT domain